MSSFRNVPWNVHAKIIWASAGLAFVGVPGAFAAHADIPIITSAWAGLSVYLIDAAGINMDKASILKLVAGVLTAITSFIIGYKTATTAAAYTGIGTVPAIVVNAGLNGIVTYSYGRALFTILIEDKNEKNIRIIIEKTVRLMIEWMKDVVR